MRVSPTASSENQRKLSGRELPRQRGSEIILRNYPRPNSLRKHASGANHRPSPSDRRLTTSIGYGNQPRHLFSTAVPRGCDPRIPHPYPKRRDTAVVCNWSNLWHQCSDSRAPILHCSPYLTADLLSRAQSLIAVSMPIPDIFALLQYQPSHAGIQPGQGPHERFTNRFSFGIDRHGQRNQPSLAQGQEFLD